MPDTPAKPKPKNKPGQGRKPSSEPIRDKFLTIRVTEAERARIQRAAKYNSAGWTQQEWLRNTLWNAAVDADMIAELEHRARCE